MIKVSSRPPKGILVTTTTNKIQNSSNTQRFPHADLLGSDYLSTLDLSFLRNPAMGVLSLHFSLGIILGNFTIIVDDFSNHLIFQWLISSQSHIHILTLLLPGWWHSRISVSSMPLINHHFLYFSNALTLREHIVLHSNTFSLSLFTSGNPLQSSLFSLAITEDLASIITTGLLVLSTSSSLPHFLEPVRLSLNAKFNSHYAWS